jgi:peptidoglycan/LPS O-acetylase OafA/YrhL
MFLIFMTVGLGLVLAGAYAFFRVFEAPFMRKSRQLAATGAAAGASLVGPSHVPAHERRGG